MSATEWQILLHVNAFKLICVWCNRYTMVKYCDFQVQGDENAMMCNYINCISAWVIRGMQSTFSANYHLRDYANVPSFVCIPTNIYPKLPVDIFVKIL